MPEGKDYSAADTVPPFNAAILGRIIGFRDNADLTTVFTFYSGNFYHLLRTKP